MNKELEKKLKTVVAFVFDVDGTLTDGRIIYNKDGNEMKSFYVRDGSRISRALKVGMRVYFISSRISPAVSARAVERKITGTLEKGKYEGRAFADFFKKENVSLEAVLYLGDDINDLLFMAQCGVKVAVADASAEVAALADYVTTCCGGYGAAGEVIEKVLRLQGKWEYPSYAQKT